MSSDEEMCKNARASFVDSLEAKATASVNQMKKFPFCVVIGQRLN